MNHPIRTIAMIEPEGDFGIGGYTYELAEGLAANGVRVDVYTLADSTMAHIPLPRRHRVLPVLGRPLFKQGSVIRGEANHGTNAHQKNASHLHHKQGRLWRLRRSRLATKLKRILLPLELALHLRRKGYDLVWTQWPKMGIYGTKLWVLCRILGMRIVHTVHNVLPHEERPGDKALCEAIYNYSHSLIVHSNCSRDELSMLFPEVRNKVIVSRHGTYTMFPRLSCARKKVRQRLDIHDDQIALLFFGGVRPYKNIDAVLAALKEKECQQAVLIVAGRESGYPDLVACDLLGRTRRLVEKLGVANRVRLIPGEFDLRQTAEIFEAGEILVLPYLQTYGSGLLLLGMTFEKFIVASRTGGMDEYLLQYPRCVLLKEVGKAHVAQGISEAISRMRLHEPIPAQNMIADLQWSNIARHTLRMLESNGEQSLGHKGGR